MSEPRNLEEALQRASALMNFYQAERRAGADPIEATERMQEYAKRLDAIPNFYQIAAE